MNFWPRLQKQLDGAAPTPAPKVVSPEVYQLMAEALYVHYLIQNMKSETKLGKIVRVLKWSPSPVTMPDSPWLTVCNPC